MAKFAVIAREAFTDLVRAFGRRGSEMTSPLSREVRAMIGQHNKLRTQVRSVYKATTGREVPEDKVVISKVFLSKLRAAVGQKKLGETRTKKFFPSQRRSELGLPRRGNPDFKSGDEYLRQRQSEEGY